MKQVDEAKKKTTTQNYRTQLRARKEMLLQELSLH